MALTLTDKTDNIDGRTSTEFSDVNDEGMTQSTYA